MIIFGLRIHVSCILLSVTCYEVKAYIHLKVIKMMVTLIMYVLPCAM